MSKGNDKQLAISFEIDVVTERVGRDLDFLSSSRDAFTDEQVLAAIEVADKADAAATSIAYAYDMRDFSKFLGRDCPVPATPKEVFMYLKHLKDRNLRCSTIGRRKAAISKAHKESPYPNPTEDYRVRKIMRGIRRMIGVRPEGKNPFTIENITRMAAVCDVGLKGARDSAMVQVAFAGALRRSELVAIDVEHISRQGNGYLLLIPKSKEDQEGIGRYVYLEDGERVLACTAIDRWKAASSIASGPLFRPINRGGFIADTRLGDDGFARMVKQRAREIGLPSEKYSGHSFRSGYITAMSAAGVPIHKIQKHTGHKSTDSMFGYFKPTTTDFIGRGVL